MISLTLETGEGKGLLNTMALSRFLACCLIFPVYPTRKHTWLLASWQTDVNWWQMYSRFCLKGWHIPWNKMLEKFKILWWLICKSRVQTSTMRMAILTKKFKECLQRCIWGRSKGENRSSPCRDVLAWVPHTKQGLRLLVYWGGTGVMRQRKW